MFWIFLLSMLGIFGISTGVTYLLDKRKQREAARHLEHQDMDKIPDEEKTREREQEKVLNQEETQKQEQAQQVSEEVKQSFNKDQKVNKQKSLPTEDKEEKNIEKPAPTTETQDVDVETQNDENLEKEILEETKNKKSRKMQGLYDDVPDEVKAGYDEVMKKTFTNELNKLEPDEIAYLNSFFKHWCDQIDVNKMDKDDGKIFAFYTKVNNRYKKLVKMNGGEIEATKDINKMHNASEAMCKKI